ncbi:MAG TPA: hypothetical protein VKV95_09645 [Terriglobia bacterium]|nr:hypothetical protein [Terriglobia bacterium]
MTKVEAKQSLAEALKKCIAETLRQSGREMPELKSYELHPILDIEGFDSQCGIEVTVELEVVLKIDDLSNNIFIKVVNGRSRARTFNEILDAILPLMGTKQ